MSLVRNKDERGSLFLLEFLQEWFSESGNAANPKRPDMGGFKKPHAANAAIQVVEPEAGRMIQTQVINLVNGVVPCPARIAVATNDRVGACGAKLLNGFDKTPVAGRPTASLPVRAQFTSTAQTWQALLFLPREGLPAGNWFAPEELDAQVPEKQGRVGFQLFASLLRFGSGWFANHALRTRRERRGCNRRVPRAGWLSLGR